MRIFKSIEIDRIRPGIWRVAWATTASDGSAEAVAITGPVYSVAKVVPVLLGLGRERTAAAKIERLRRLTREQGWPEPEMRIYPPEEDK